MRKVYSIADLHRLAGEDERYLRLAKIAASNLGGLPGDCGTLPGAIRWLEINALETDEEGVVGEINFCLDLVKPLKYRVAATPREQLARITAAQLRASNVTVTLRTGTVFTRVTRDSENGKRYHGTDQNGEYRGFHAVGVATVVLK